LEQGFELGFVKALGDERQELFEKRKKGTQGLEGIAGPAVDGLDGGVQ
jgi:hypothetical protein